MSDDETKLENGRVKMRGESVYRVRMSQAQYREICGATTTHEWVLLNVFQYVIEEEQFADLPASFDLQDLQNKLPGRARFDEGSASQISALNLLEIYRAMLTSIGLGRSA